MKAMKFFMTALFVAVMTFVLTACSDAEESVLFAEPEKVLVEVPGETIEKIVPTYINVHDTITEHSVENYDIRVVSGFAKSYVTIRKNGELMFHDVTNMAHPVNTVERSILGYASITSTDEEGNGKLSDGNGWYSKTASNLKFEENYSLAPFTEVDSLNSLGTLIKNLTIDLPLESGEIRQEEIEVLTYFLQNVPQAPQVITEYVDREIPVETLIHDSLYIIGDVKISKNVSMGMVKITAYEDGKVISDLALNVDSLLIHTTKEEIGKAKITTNNGINGKSSDKNGWSGKISGTNFSNVKVNTLEFQALDSLTAMGTFHGTVDFNVKMKDGSVKSEVISFELPYVQIRPYIKVTTETVTETVTITEYVDKYVYENFTTEVNNNFQWSEVIISDGEETASLKLWLTYPIINRTKENIGLAGVATNNGNNGSYTDGQKWQEEHKNSASVRFLSVTPTGVNFNELDSLTQQGSALFDVTVLLTLKDGSVKEVTLKAVPLYLHVRPAELPKEPEVIEPEETKYTTVVKVQKIESGSQLYAEGSISITGTDGSSFAFTTNVAMIGRYNDAKDVVVKTGLTLMDGQRKSALDTSYNPEPESYKKGKVEVQESRQKIIDNRFYMNPAGGKSGMGQDVLYYTWNVTFHGQDGKDYILEMSTETEFLDDKTYDDPAKERQVTNSGETSTYQHTLVQSANHYLSATLKVDGRSYPVDIQGLETINGKQLFKHNEATMPIYTRD